MENSSRLDAIVVGAGFAGLYLLYRLRAMGFSAHAFEAGGDVGGTWYWNKYPGARCDVDSLSYSYSFSPELEQEWEWSEKYAAQPEILRYLQHVTDRFDLRRDITFEVRVNEAVWKEKSHSWRVSLSSGKTFESRFLILATGCLSKPKKVEIRGADTFAGATYYTSSWPEAGVDFTGQKVVIIGTGSSAIQSIPLIAAQAKHLTVLQRTAAYSLPAFNRPLAETESKARKADYRLYRADQRNSTFGVPMLVPSESALSASMQARHALYEEKWQEGALTAIFGSYTDILTNQAANDTAAEFVRTKIRTIVKDPGVAEMLCPRGFPFGTKRPCLDTDYYDTFNRPNVRLVDVTQTPLVEINTRGLQTTVEEMECDAIVFATGFDAMTGAILGIRIEGVDGVTLQDSWANGPHSYLGVAITGFPNLFTVTGPGSPSVLSNMVVSIEQHVDWITDCLDALRRKGATRIEADSDAEQDWTGHVAEVASQTLYPLANSWYMGANVPGKPKVFMAYVGGVGTFRAKCNEVAANCYAGFHIGPQAGSMFAEEAEVIDG